MRRADEPVNGRAIFELLVNAARLARPRKAREPSPARAHPPGRHGHFERLRLAGEVFYLHSTPPQLTSQVLVIFVEPGLRLPVLLGDERVVDCKCRIHGFPSQACHCSLFICHLSFVITRRHITMPDKHWAISEATTDIK